MESSCCGASGGEFIDIGICPECKEPCGFDGVDEIDETVYAEPADLSAKLKRQFALTMTLTLFVGIAFGYYCGMAQAAALVLGAR